MTTPAPLVHGQPMSAGAIAQLNACDRRAFVALLGPVFEHAPHVAESAFAQRPFANAGQLHDAMIQVVKGWPKEQRIAFICGHPELAGKEAAASTLTRESESEQSGAGLKSLSRPEVEEIGALNQAYRARHGFPFVICVRHYTKTGIFAEFKRRTARSTDVELDEALAQIGFITRLRLADLLRD